MAARKKRFHDQKTKDLIRASQLLNSLTKFALGKSTMKSAQVRAAEIVIGKSIPDLKSVEVTGDPEKPVEVNKNLVVHFVTPPSRPHE
jgi:hypothetical protein